jgi:hypothetical protein|uniref:Uncharacterized protein n=1 Tax=Attheya septentrionalis TaxID=420275 RepID=A0A7S2XKV8_9STRA|mmetsp:Transcript_10229/g.18599  ORF Transcript_10229/g.18599 Transcript_10229/m.18599 type:complete len:186 (+) Transcript_10229:47-604(+)
MGIDQSKFRTNIQLKNHPLNTCGWAERFVLQCLSEWARITGKKTMRTAFFVFDPETNRMIAEAYVGNPSGRSDMFKTMRVKAMIVYRQQGGGKVGLRQQAGRIRKVMYRGPDGQIHTAMVMGDWIPGLTFSPDELRPACTQALLSGLAASGCVMDANTGTPNVFSLPDAVVAAGTQAIVDNGKMR